MMIPNSIIILGKVVLVKVAQMKYLLPGVQINHGVGVCMKALNILNNKLRSTTSFGSCYRRESRNKIHSPATRMSYLHTKYHYSFYKHFNSKFL